jgi:hypothetical protein
VKDIARYLEMCKKSAKKRKALKSIAEELELRTSQTANNLSQKRIVSLIFFSLS